MSTRYVAFVDGNFDQHADKTLVVHELERKPVRTGLLDKRGVAIYRVEDTYPIGFHNFGGKRAS